jgi:hypothetical protein
VPKLTLLIAIGQAGRSKTDNTKARHWILSHFHPPLVTCLLSPITAARTPNPTILMLYSDPVFQITLSPGRFLVKILYASSRLLRPSYTRCDPKVMKYIYFLNLLMISVQSVSIPQAGRLRVRFLMSLDFSTDLIFPAASWPWGCLSL